jgi:hypothetical protein
MSLVNWILRASVGTQPTALALFAGDKEVTVPGYKRVPIRNWKIEGPTARALVPLGGYGAPVTYDRYVIFSGDERVETVMEGSTVQLPAGWLWEWDTGITLGG